jgi:hypothetical protein
MAGFGVAADPLSFTDTEVEIQSVSVSPAGSEAQCEDSNGDIIESTVYGEHSPIEVTYKVCTGGTFPTATKLGDTKGSYIITGITATRNNKDALSVSVSALPSAIFIIDSSNPTPKYTIPWPTGYLAGGIGALNGAFIPSAGRTISSSISATVSFVIIADSVGDPACTGLYGGRAEGSNEVQTCDTAVAGAADTANGWTLAAGSGATNETNTEYQTGTFTTFQNITQD